MANTEIRYGVNLFEYTIWRIYDFCGIKGRMERYGGRKVVGEEEGRKEGREGWESKWIDLYFGYEHFKILSILLKIYGINKNFF